MKRYYIVFKGIVQGVGFRFKASNIASRYGFTGYVRNMYNGDVEVEIQGNEPDLFLQDILKKDRFIQIFDYAIKQIPIKENESNFDVRF